MRRTLEVNLVVSAAVDVLDDGMTFVVGLDEGDSEYLADGCDVWDLGADEWLNGDDPAADVAYQAALRALRAMLKRAGAGS